MIRKLLRSSDAESESLALLHASRSDHDPTDLDRLVARRALAERLVHAPGVHIAGEHAAIARLAAPAKLWIVGACVSVAAVGAVATMSSTSRRAPVEARAALAERQPDPPSMIVPPEVRAAEPNAELQLEPKPTEPASRIEPEKLSTAPAANARHKPKPADLARLVETPRRATVPATKPGRVARGGSANTAARAGTDESRSIRDDTTARTPEPQGLATAPDPAPAPEVASASSASPRDESAPTRARALPQASVRQDSPRELTELAWMQQIESALRGGNPRRVLELCAEHERRWPRGLFAQERDGVRALASCQLHLPENQPRARAFLASHPQSALAPRVRAECGLKRAAKSGEATRGK